MRRVLSCTEVGTGTGRGGLPQWPLGPPTHGNGLGGGLRGTEAGRGEGVRSSGRAGGGVGNGGTPCTQTRWGVRDLEAGGGRGTGYRCASHASNNNMRLPVPGVGLRLRANPPPLASRTQQQAGGWRAEAPAGSPPRIPVVWVEGSGFTFGSYYSMCSDLPTQALQLVPSRSSLPFDVRFSCSPRPCWPSLPARRCPSPGSRSSCAS